MDVGSGNSPGHASAPRHKQLVVEWATAEGPPRSLAEMQVVAVKTLEAIVGSRQGRILFGSRTGPDGRTRWCATWWPEVSAAQ